MQSFRGTILLCSSATQRRNPGWRGSRCDWTSIRNHNAQQHGDWTRQPAWCAIAALNRKEETMAKAPSSESRDRVRGTVPKMIELTEKVLFGDVWERPQLSKRDRSLIVCATLISTYRPEQLRGHLQRALDNGVTKEEL